MITGDIKQKVDVVWQTFWNNGFTQPSAIFEQMTYLLFMKMLDEKQLEKESITNLTGDAQAYKTIRSALVNCHCLRAVITMPSGVFQPYSGVSAAVIICSCEDYYHDSGLANGKHDCTMWSILRASRRIGTPRWC